MHNVPLHTYGAGQGAAALHWRTPHTPDDRHRIAPPQSASAPQLRRHAAYAPQVVVPGQSLSPPQPVQMPPGAATLHVA